MPTAFPLQWPDGVPRTKSRKDSPFSKRETVIGDFGAELRTASLSLGDAIERLDTELDRLGARMVMISSNIEPVLGGKHRVSKANEDPGVAVYFELSGSAHCLPCDTFKRAQDNIAAIAAHIEATRKIARLGVATVDQMFKGFVALPARKKWWEVLEISRDGATRRIVENAYRRLAKVRHPDRPGGTHDLMAELNSAKDEAFTELP